MASSRSTCGPRAGARSSWPAPILAPPPAINPNFFAEDEDIQTILSGLHLGRRVLGSPAFERFKAHEIIPGAGTQSDAEWLEHIRKTCVSVHPTRPEPAPWARRRARCSIPS